MRYSERIVDSTKPGKYFLLVVFLLLLSAITAMGQTREERKMRIQAVKALRAEKFAIAKEIYTDLLKLDPNNPDYNYEMGLVIYEEGIHRGKAAPYLERAIQNTKQDTLPDMFLYAGKSEQYAGHFDLAIGYYEQYIALLERKDMTPEELGEDVERYIQMCENGKVQFENNRDYVRIENMGASINSEFQDYAPVVTNDESVILFTSRRDNTVGGLIADDDKYFEDIYYSLNIDGTYTPASNMDSSNRFMNSQINTSSHDATITFAADETQLFIYRDLDVWVSKLEDGYWTVPSKAQGRINSEKGFEPSVFITQDQATMFVVSDINSGTGGRDIYITTKDEFGQWKPLENLGPNINTKHNEDAPFLTPDGNTLYFASDGHNSMGDYDIFKSVLDDQGNWSKAENLGPPINTPGHDRYFVTSDDGAVGYYSSDRDGGYGETDIYRIILDCKAVSATMISGVVFSEDLGGPVATTITIFDPKTNVVINTYESDSITGKYEMRLQTEKTYGFKIDANGYLPHAGEFTVPKQCDYFTLFQEIKIENLEDESGQVYAQRASINNAFFNVDKKVEESLDGRKIEQLSAQEKDSLRSMVAENYNPIELTNYIQMIDVVDPEGIRLASGQIGSEPVATIQTRDALNTSYQAKIDEADRLFYKEYLPEARANYMIASNIRPDEQYPKQQVEIIENKLNDQPFTANLSSVPEEDRGHLIVPQLIDSSSLQIPSEIAEVLETTPDEVIEQKIEEVVQQQVEAPKEVPATPEPVVETPVEEAPIAETPVKEDSVEEAPKQEEIAEVAPVKEAPIAEKPVEQAPAEEVVEEAVVATAPEIVEEEVAEAPTPKPTPEPAAAEETIVFRNILFDFDKSDLRKESIVELNKVTDYMKRKPQVEVQIDGHADWIGTIEYNLALSERRAKAASEYLLNKGVEDARVTYQYYGESVPIAPNANPDGSDNPDGRQLNRRCEFKIDQKGTAQNVVLKF